MTPNAVKCWHWAAEPISCRVARALAAAAVWALFGDAGMAWVQPSKITGRSVGRLGYHLHLDVVSGRIFLQPVESLALEPDDEHGQDNERQTGERHEDEGSEVGRR